ncbi:hypothetical protein D477_019828 [Arthrobacter crystallopoietes BAB-32]|uniref:Sporulation protein YtfJ n=1 Tax=Arthrobacter crystallopoietes BAB-32 TaxID=1246476 RepID=N1V2L5_9MICC|nr:hypothetical protein [Arthrobacter crystallopoietes]EMY32498.1 hypothetical protein D477_019828 [Arthrobacter crystallopoietes BAB-32]
MSNESPASPRRGVLAQLSDDFKSFAVRRAFGEPVQVGDEQVIPVALVQCGFGGGGSGDDGGGGGGGIVLPVGVLASGENGRVDFRPNPVALLAVMVPLVWASGRAAARIIAALRGHRR